MKSELRKQVLQEMKALSQEQKQAMDRALTKQLKLSQPISLFLTNFKRRN